MKPIYALYHSTKENIIKIIRCNERNKMYATWSKYLEGVETTYAVYNDCYIISYDRKVIKSLAEQMKARWINDARERLTEIENIKI